MTYSSRYPPPFPLLCAALLILGGWIQSDMILNILKHIGQITTGVSLGTSGPDVILCPQADPIIPILHAELSKQMDLIYSSQAFKHASYKLLSGSVRIPTESYDDLLPVGQDERWNIFTTFRAYLQDSFPLVYSSLEITSVNTHGLVFHWQGSDGSLKPLLLTAHQDVIPVDWSNADQWVHPPYSGDYDGTWIWGRGSVDDKADLIARLITVDSLLKAGFQPRRTLVLAFGFDEEASGVEGAGKLAVYLEEKYGRNAFAMLLDEGEGYNENVKGGMIFALPGVSEKGYLDASIQVVTPGGHSSVPPHHTSIGILSEIIVALEATSHIPRLTRNGTAFYVAQCAVEYSPQGRLPPIMKDLARRAMNPDDEAALEKFASILFKAIPLFDVLSRTTQAVDMINGGVKSNALPERAEAIINHRVAEYSSTTDVKNHIRDLVLPLGIKHNLFVDDFGRGDSMRSDVQELGKIILSIAFGHTLEPSPVTPVTNNDMYNLLSGTIKATLQTSSRYQADGVVVMPSLGLGNTDTHFYWNLSNNIFRYSHRGDRDDIYGDIHTVNEAIRGEAFIEEIRFLTRLVLNMDEFQETE
ncbi:carboxypeptidase S [Lentinula raphanica]|nr:carboxypeptidase S [Lentinula raphanica]